MSMAEEAPRKASVGDAPAYREPGLCLQTSHGWSHGGLERLSPPLAAGVAAAALLAHRRRQWDACSIPT